MRRFITTIISFNVKQFCICYCAYWGSQLHSIEKLEKKISVYLSLEYQEGTIHHSGEDLVAGAIGLPVTKHRQSVVENE